jgi:hypothetical protein
MRKPTLSAFRSESPESQAGRLAVGSAQEKDSPRTTGSRASLDPGTPHERQDGRRDVRGEAIPGIDQPGQVGVGV